MASGGGNPHGVKVEYENVKIVATEQVVNVYVRTSSGVHGTQISMVTGAVTGSSVEPH